MSGAKLQPTPEAIVDSVEEQIGRDLEGRLRGAGRQGGGELNVASASVAEQANPLVDAAIDDSLRGENTDIGEKWSLRVRVQEEVARVAQGLHRQLQAKQDERQRIPQEQAETEVGNRKNRRKKTGSASLAI